MAPNERHERHATTPQTLTRRAFVPRRSVSARWSTRLWTSGQLELRSNRPACRGQRCALPTAAASAHLTTAFDHGSQNNSNQKIRKIKPEDTRGWASRCFLRHQFDLKLTPDSACVTLECGKRRRVLASRFEARDRALGGAHTFSDGVLRKASARTRLEHLTRDLASAAAAARRPGAGQGLGRHELIARAVELLHAGHDGVARHARRSHDLRDASEPQLGRCERSPLALVQMLPR